MTTTVSPLMLGKAPVCSSVGRNIKATNAGSATSVTITASEFVVKDASGNAALLSGVNVTAALTTTGANGLDVAGTGASKHVYGYVIYNPVTGTVAGLLSASATAPTLPSGYTYFALITAFKTDATPNIWGYTQVGNKVLPSALRSLSTSITTNTEITVSTTAWVPPITQSVGVQYTNFSGSCVSGSIDFQPFIRLSTGVNSINGMRHYEDSQSASAGRHFGFGTYELPYNGGSFIHVMSIGSGSLASSAIDLAWWTLPVGGF